MQLVDLRPLLPDAIFDIRYATTNNITGEILYPQPYAQLTSEAAGGLAKAATWFRARSLRVVIWDGYRSVEVQRKLLTANSDQRYVRKPEESYHCKGRAIDLTLARADGTYLDMGTDHDDFSPRAHVGCASLTSEQADNRQLLTIGMLGAGFSAWSLDDGMVTAGFSVWPFEWWHFNYLLKAHGLQSNAADPAARNAA